MLDKKVAELLNDQINKELYSAYIYLDMANFYADYGLDGFENWFYIQAQEERDHAMLIRNYLKDNGHKITSEAIEKPEYTYSDIKDPLNVTLEHEKIVTGLINNIYAAAHDVKDYRTMHFLDWFVNEQMEDCLLYTSRTGISCISFFGTGWKSNDFFIFMSEFSYIIFFYICITAITMILCISLFHTGWVNSISLNKICMIIGIYGNVIIFYIISAVITVIICISLCYTSWSYSISLNEICMIIGIYGYVIIFYIISAVITVIICISLCYTSWSYSISLNKINMIICIYFSVFIAAYFALCFF